MDRRRINPITRLLIAASLAMFASQAHATEAVIGDGHIALYLSDPGVSVETAGDTDADDAVVALIDNATERIDLCVYDFAEPTVIDAIVAAYERGVAVRFVGDADEHDQAGYTAIVEAGIPASLRTKSGLMHNKFMVVDDTWVVTGSMNFSPAGFHRNNNHLLVIDNENIAFTYVVEFEQMFIDALFGTSKVAFEHPPVTLGGTTVDVVFSPKDDPEVAVRAALATADHSVYFMTFSFTRDDIAGDLIAHHDAGVEVIGIYDRLGASNAYATDEQLAEAGLPVLIDGNRHQVGSSGGKLHHKVMIIDAGTDSDPIVIAGSYNWSHNASDTNDENIIILRGSEAIAPFMAEFCELYGVAEPHALTTAALPDPCTFVYDAPTQAPAASPALPARRAALSVGRLGLGALRRPNVFIGEAEPSLETRVTKLAELASLRPLPEPAPEPELAPAQVAIIALMPDPMGTDLGQEYVVFANLGDLPADLSGLRFSDGVRERHVFAAGTTLEPGETLTLHDRGEHGGAVCASAAALSLNNTGDTLTLADASGHVLDQVTYASSAAGQELALGIDF